MPTRRRKRTAGELLTLHLARHGETTWNVEERLQGQVRDVPLTDRGRSQAVELVDAIADRPVGAVYSSDLPRAVETARPIAERFGLPIVQDPALRERHLGKLQGRLVRAVREAWGDELREHWHDPDHTYEGGESYRELYDRVAGFLDSLRSEPPADEIVIVAHSGPVRVAAAYLDDVPVEEMRWSPIENATLQTYRVPRAVPV